MDQRKRMILASAGVVAMFVAVQIGSLALVEPFQQEGHQVVDDTDDPSWSIYYLLAILIITALMLTALKRGGQQFLRLLIIFAGVYIAFFVFEVLVPPILSVSAVGVTFNLLSWGGALALGAALYFYPEWYVIDAAGIIMGIGAAGLFGVNLSIFPVIVLLVGLAIYDAISVYKTEHMLTLASGAMDMRVPVVLVIPLSFTYSFLDDENVPDPASEHGRAEETKGSPAEHVTDGNEATEAVTTTDGVDTAAESDRSDPSLDAETLEELGPVGISELEPEQLATIDESTLKQLDDLHRDAIEDALPRRDALFIGLGDAVIPTVLVASAAVFVDTTSYTLLGITVTLPALTAMAGTIVGLVLLLWLVSKGRAHAGLPLLNGGAITGYVIGALLSGLSLAEAIGYPGGPL